MKKIIIKCSNCGSTDFVPTVMGQILATEGSFNVNAYACLKCGHIELFDPEMDLFARQIREEQAERRRKEKLEQQKKEEIRKKRIEELKDIINNEDSTIRQVKAAEQELKKLGYDETIAVRRT